MQSKDEILVLARQFIKFGIVGVSSTLITLAVYYVLVFLSVHYAIAYAVAFAISVMNAFYWNRRFVFKQASEKIKIKQIAKVYVSYGFTLLISTCILMLFVDVIGISDMIAPIITLCIIVPMNFFLNKFWAFKE